MSVTAMSLAWYVEGLSPAQKVVLVALADHADDDGTHVYPSVKRLVLKTSYAERTIRRALSDLRDMNLIHVVRESKYHRATEYRLDLPEMQVLQNRPARAAPHDLPESPTDLPENTNRPARDAPNPSYNHHKPSGGNHKEIYIHPDSEPIAHLKTALCTISKQRLAAGFNEELYDKAAYTLDGWNATPADVEAFGEWWEAGNGYYDGKPAIKSIIGSWQEFLERDKPKRSAIPAELEGIIKR